MKLKEETGLSVYQIMQEIQPCSYLDKDGRALTPNFTMPEDRYIDFNNVRGDNYNISPEKRQAIIDRFNEVGIIKLCEERQFSIQDIFGVRLCNATLAQIAGWRRKAREAKKNES